MDPFNGKRGEGQSLQIIGKLKPGVSLDQANVDVATTAARPADEYKDSNDSFTASVQRFTDSFIGPEPRQLLFTMLGAAFFVLLVACANVANLLLDRAAHRTKEVGIRTALGASRSAVIFGEGALQFAVGMGSWLALPLGISRLMVTVLCKVEPRDPTVFGGVAVVLAAVGLLACLVPARRATGVDPLVALRGD